jgi:DNA primase
VIGLQQAGVAEAVATCGTALADGHIRLLTNFARRIVLAYDADTAGQAAAERFYEWEDRFQVDIRVATIPAGADPADLARTDPEALSKAVDEAQPFLGFRLERLLARSDLSSPETRARAAGEAMELIREHPNELVRDQYVMQVADHCRVDPDRLRTMEAPAARSGPYGRQDRDAGAGARRSLVSSAPPAPIPLSGPELEALRLAVHRPEEVASRLEVVLFEHPLARTAFDVLSGAATFHEAVEAADPQTSDLLQRLAAEDAITPADDVMKRLAERAGQRAMRDLQAEMRQAPALEQASYPATIGWLKLTLEEMRLEEPSAQNSSVAAEERLIRWLVARDEQACQPEATQ